MCYEILKKKEVRTGLTGSWSGIRYIHKWACSLWERLVVDSVCDCRGLLLLGFPKVIVGQQHRGPVICGTGTRTRSAPQDLQSRWLQLAFFAASQVRRPYVAGVVLTNSLHGVPLLDEKLGSRDIDVHPQRLLLFVDRLCWTCVLTEERKAENFKIWKLENGCCSCLDNWSAGFVKMVKTYLMSISAKLFASGQQKEMVTFKNKDICVRNRDVTQPFLISPRSLLSLCSLLLLLSTSRPMKMTTIPTSTQEMVTIIFKPSPPPELSSLTLGAFTKGAMVPAHRSRHVVTNTGIFWLILFVDDLLSSVVDL